MEWIFRGIGLLAMLFVVKTILNKTPNRKTEDEFVIRLPYRLKELGISLTSMSSIGVLFISFMMDKSDDKTIVLVVFTIFVLVSLMLIIIDSRLKNIIYDDRVVIQRLFTSRTIHYSETSYTLDGHNLVIMTSELNKRIYINYSYKNTGLLLKKIENYHKRNNVANKYSHDIVRGNFYTKNFGITFTVISLFVAFIVVVLISEASTNEFLFAYVFGVLFGILPLLVGVFFLLLYFNFSVIIEPDKLLRNSIFGKTKEYKITNLTVKATTNGLKIYCDGKFLFYLNTWFFDNTNNLKAKLKRK